MISDRVLCYLSNLVYSEEKPSDIEDDDEDVKAFEIFEETRDEDTGLLGKLYFKKDKEEGYGVFAFMGTSSGAGGKLYAAQLRANYELKQDPDEDEDILRAANKFVAEASKKLEEQHSGLKWHFLATGHSLGGFQAAGVTIGADPKIERCVTFENPGSTKFYREKALKAHGSEYWRERITEYVTFPNPINTTLPKIGRVVRLVLDIHSTLAPTHVARCVLGSALNVMVWGSILNLAASAVPVPGIGRVQGFWAAKVWSGTRKFSRKLLVYKGNAKRALREARQDAKKQADQEGASGTAEDRLKLVPFLPSLAPRVKGALVTSLWALGTVAATSVSYVATRSSGNMADCALDHATDNLLKGFDKESGKPKRAIEMVEWPYHEQLIAKSFTTKHMRRVIFEGLLPFRASAYGIHNLFSRFELLLRRARSLPGYKEGDVIED